MEAEDRLAAQVAGPGRVLFVGAGPTLPPGSVVFQQDIRVHALCAAAGLDATFGAWLDPPAEPYDECVVRMPRAAGRLRMNLTMARACVRPGGAITVVGHNDGGIRAAPRDVERLVGEPSVVATRWHCRAVRAVVPSAFPAAHLQDFASRWSFDDIAVTSFPGVFADGRLDPGTALLLRALAGHGLEGARLLDLGCGSGVIAAWAARRGAHAEGCDTDAVAVEAAAATGAPYGVRAFASDLYGSVEGTYDVIATNPPFHRDGRVSLSIARALLAGAPARLTRAGELWMVVNRFLDHTATMREGFASFDLVAEDGRYRVWRARRA